MNPTYNMGNNPQQVRFNPGCRKCSGTGQIYRKGGMRPCKKCYRNAGICTRCYGTGWNQRKNRQCKRCATQKVVIVRQGQMNQPQMNQPQMQPNQYQQNQYKPVKQRKGKKSSSSSSSSDSD